jgi:hypothetical protein
MSSNFRNSQEFIDKIFGAKQAQTGGVVRRSSEDVHRYASEAELVAAVKERGFHMVQSGDQFVIFCNQGEFKIIA